MARELPVKLFYVRDRKQNINYLENIRRKTKYVPSLYDNPDTELSIRIKRFLCEPPFNSEEYFHMLQNEDVIIAESPSVTPLPGIVSSSLPPVSEKLTPFYIHFTYFQ